MSELNLCDDCTKWPCGHHSPRGVAGYLTTECANRIPSSAAELARLRADLKATQEAARMHAASHMRLRTELAEARGTLSGERKGWEDAIKLLRAENEALRTAAGDVIESASHSYDSAYIEGDDGELMSIVPFEPMHNLRIALARQTVETHE